MIKLLSMMWNVVIAEKYKEWFNETKFDDFDGPYLDMF
jgi:hypothetical protein